MTPAELDRLEVLAAAATPGLSLDDPDGDRDFLPTVPERSRYAWGSYVEVAIPTHDSPTGRYYAQVPSEPDALLLVEARPGVLALVAEVRRLTAERDAAVAAERERCALLCEEKADIAEEYGSTDEATGAQDCARAIRRGGV